MLPPRSISSHHSNLGQETWPLDPPGPSEFEYVKRYAFAKLQEWKARITQDDRLIEEIDPHLGGNLVKEEVAYQHHLVHAYNNWQNLSQETKQEEWRLECQKAYAEEYDRHQDTRDRLDQLEQEIHHLRDQLNQSKNGASSSDNFPLSSIPLSSATIATVNSRHAHDSQHWDYDGLVDKWKHRLHQQRSTQQPLPTVPPWSPNRRLNGTPSAYDQNSYHEEGDNEMEDEDLADAPGEDEEGGMVDRGVLDPNLRPGNGNMDDGSRLLMELGVLRGTNGNGGAGR